MNTAGFISQKVIHPTQKCGIDFFTACHSPLCAEKSKQP